MNRRRARRRFGLGIGLIVIAGVALIALLATTGAPTQNPGIASHYQPITSVRTVQVAMHDDGMLSMPGQPLHTIYMGGDKPGSLMMATVLTDENCAPNADGVTHCTNRLRLDGGGVMVVQHPHRMSDVPCLSPGERVKVEATA